jgi:hypothetical protein
VSERQVRQVRSAFCAIHDRVDFERVGSNAVESSAIARFRVERYSASSSPGGEYEHILKMRDEKQICHYVISDIH